MPADPNRLDAGDFLNASDPFAVFEAWLAQAAETEPNDPNAAALATVDADGMPNVRIILVKAVGTQGFVFYTNFESTKGQELLGQRAAALCFHWKTLGRQVRVRGTIDVVADDVADSYFGSRPRGSRIGAWASQQSRPMETTDALKQRVDALTEQYGEDAPIPRPDHWSGFQLSPLSFELWHDRPYRLHDRVQFTRPSTHSAWSGTQLYP
ncbi:MAG: pyridoxamine 5'-phosphate oxidase [Devosiaceae bacterium]|nr:pyridoxamine 5'-phosphate oxidase [Devosiaceae bacterium MH13]